MTDTPRDPQPVGAVLASALMSANYPGDSGEDVDRLIAELEKRGYRLVGDADDDEILAAVVEAHRDARSSGDEALRAAAIAADHATDDDDPGRADQPWRECPWIKRHEAFADEFMAALAAPEEK